MRLKTAHVSLQFGDTDKQHTEDIEKIFDRAVERDWAWITGTESGPGAGNTSAELIRVAREHGYRPWVPEAQGKGIERHTDCWIAVKADLIDSGWEKGYIQVIPGSGALQEQDPKAPKNKRFGPKGVVHVAFTNDRLGRISVGAAHYLTGARGPHSYWWQWNEKLARAIGDWADAAAAGADLAFYGGDQNMADSKNNEPQGDTFFGEALTSAWDELGRWENTGHGNIDVIASYDRDLRVTAKRAFALDDSEFFLHTDHFLVEAVFEVEEVTPTPPPPVQTLHACPLCAFQHNGVVRNTTS